MVNKITQIYVSPSVKFFEKKINNILKLQKYSDPEKGTLFFGIYSIDKIILNHKGPCIYMLAGSDISPYYNSKENFEKKINFFKNIDKKREKIITISNFQNKVFKDNNIPFTNLNIGWTINKNVKLVKKKPGIYIYTSAYNDNYYGSYIYEELYNKLNNKFKFYFAIAREFNSNKITFTQKNVKHYPNPIDAYKECFIGLRLVPFDGNANTVKELGLCGIRVIHNGNDINCIKWNFDPILFNKNISNDNPEKMKIRDKVVNQLINIIMEQTKFIGTINKKLRKKVRDRIIFKKISLDF